MEIKEKALEKRIIREIFLRMTEIALREGFEEPEITRAIKLFFADCEVKHLMECDLECLCLEVIDGRLPNYKNLTCHKIIENSGFAYNIMEGYLEMDELLASFRTYLANKELILEK